MYAGNEGNPGDIDYLSCPKLESLEFQFSKAYKKWKKFFENHNQLKKLQLKSMILPVLADFTKSLTELVEVDIDCERALGTVWRWDV